MTLLSYIFAFLLYLYSVARLVQYFGSSSSTLVSRVDSAILDLNATFPVEVTFLQLINDLLSEAVQEIESSVFHGEDRGALIAILNSYHHSLHTFHNALRHSDHSYLSDPLPAVLIEILSHVRQVASILQLCRSLNFFDHDFGALGPSALINARVEMEKTSISLKYIIQPRLVHRALLDDLVRTRIPLEMSSEATPRMYRFVECTPLVEQGILQIKEISHLPSEPYSTISYVWRGNPVAGAGEIPAFTVCGAEDADPISVELLHNACMAALRRGTSLLWIDRLCIMQNNRDDKNWQITKMYNIYRFCTFCIIFPGGLGRLVSLKEETQWIHRGWTLQEALAPPSIEVLFSWELGELMAKPSTNDGFHGTITEVIEGRCAMAPLWLILDACVAGSLTLTKLDAVFSHDQFDDIRIFGVGTRGYTGSDFRFALPNVAALAAAVSRSLSEDYDRKCYTIWKCALMRTSSRPVDMVFSIMGLFGVSLDVSKFDTGDRVGATIALAREILEKGGRANWLGVSFHVPPYPQLSTFPTFPRTAVAGKALVRTPQGYIEISKLMDNEYPIAEVLGPMPRGSMSPDGYLRFNAKAVRIFRLPPDLLLDSVEYGPELNVIKATNGSAWAANEQPAPSTGTPEAPPEQQPQAFAVLLGCFFGYHPTVTPSYDCHNVRGLIVLEQLKSKERFYVDSYFMLSIRFIDWAVSWTERDFCIGGPEGVNGVHLDEPLVEIDVVSAIYISPPDEHTTFASIKSDHITALAMAAKPSRD